MSVVELDDLSVAYGRRCALRPLTDRLASGEWLGVIGPNGAGKSSMLRAIAGLVQSAGTVRVGGDPLEGLRERARARRVAYVPQTPLIPDDMTAGEYVLLGRTPYISYFGAASVDDRRVVDGVLDQLELVPFADRRLGELSGGERQRAVIGRALAQEAPVLLLDEPTSALDIGHQQQALELVSALRAEHGLTVISALHDLTLAGTYADRLLLLDAGHAVASGPPADVLTADLLAATYHVSVRVEHDGDDVIVTPRRRS